MMTMTEPSTPTALDGTSDVEQDIIGMVVAERGSMREPDLELRQSVNQWIDRVRSLTAQAHQSARAGSLIAERDSWVALAAVAVGAAVSAQRRFEAARGSSPPPTVVTERPFCATCGSTDRTTRYAQAGESQCSDPWHDQTEDR